MIHPPASARARWNQPSATVNGRSHFTDSSPYAEGVPCWILFTYDVKRAQSGVKRNCQDMYGWLLVNIVPHQNLYQTDRVPCYLEDNA